MPRAPDARTPARSVDKGDWFVCVEIEDNATGRWVDGSCLSAG